MRSSRWAPPPRTLRIHTTRASLTVALSLLLAAALPAGASAALGDLVLVSRADGAAGALGDGNSYLNARAVSSDGRFVAFASYSQNLGGTAVRDIYRRDLALGRTELVSRADGAAGAAGDDVSFGYSMSADGNRIAFVSGADNLSAADNNTYTNIFVRDMAAGTTTLASRASGPAGAAANNGSLIPEISGDGTVVAFQSQATNIDPTVTDNNAQVDVYVRDLKDDTTRLLSKSTGGALGNGLSTVGDISADGRLVTIDTEATTLGGTVAPGSGNVYVRDRVANTTTLVSQPTGTSNASGNAEAGASTITAAGDRVGFVSRSTNLAPDQSPANYQFYVRDLGANTTTMVSRSAAGAPADGNVEPGAISPDGSIVAFTTGADNLDGPPSSVDQAFVHDLTTGSNALISRAGRDGAPGDRAAAFATPGQSNRLVAFESDATNLAAEATGAKHQVFVRDVKVVDPATIAAKKFTAKLRKRVFKVSATTGGGATGVSGKATIRVSKKFVRSGKLIVRFGPRTVPAARTKHTLAFKLSKRQNRLVLKALRSKRTRLRVTLSLRATGPGAPGAATVTGKLRR